MRSISSVNDPTTDTHELAWAAGFVDGEGCFSTMTNRRGKLRNYPLLTISQREPRYVLDRFMHAVGVGYVNGPYHAYAHKSDGTKVLGKPAYYYRANGFDRVYRVIKLLWPWLSPVKRAQALKVIRAYREVH